MVPSDLIGYFTASAAVAGTLIGLLFVSISLRYEAILGNTAEFRAKATAAASFTGLVNALTISLLSLIPDVGIGYVASISAAICLGQTLRLHAGKIGARGSSWGSFLLSLAVYLSQVVVGIILIIKPDSPGLVFTLAYTIFGAFVSSLSRAWELLQPSNRQAPEETAPPDPVGSAGPPG